MFKAKVCSKEVIIESFQSKSIVTFEMIEYADIIVEGNIQSNGYFTTRTYTWPKGTYKLICDPLDDILIEEN